MSTLAKFYGIIGCSPCSWSKFSCVVGWIPDLTTCGDVESNPGPTWNEIKIEVHKRVGEPKPALIDALKEIEECLNNLNPDVMYLDGVHLRPYLNDNPEKHSKLLVDLFEKIMRAEAG